MFLYTIIGLAIGAFIGSRIANHLAAQQAKKLEQEAANTQEKAKLLISQAETKEQEILVRAKDKAIKILEDARLEEKRLNEELKAQRNELTARENEFGKKLLEVDDVRKQTEAKAIQLVESEKSLEEKHQEVLKRLEEISGMPKEKALEQLLAKVEDESKDTIVSRIHKLDEMETEEIEKKAKDIIALSIQRLASSTVAETTTSYVELPNDEMKGRIIGREGRNIKAIEWLTGCELIVDDTPGMITVSSFSPIRRQVAKRALEKLIADGRIHPGRIEDCIEEAKKDLSVEIKKAGEEALFTLGISMAGIDPKLIQILGRLKFRTSYGQNALMHSMEVSMLAAMMAEELKANVSVCRKGGLFHDIGKAVDHDMQGSHPELGYQIMKKFGFPEELCYQSIGHHEDKPKTIEAVIVKAADAISGARPGARKDNLEMYVKRLEELESTALSFKGVDKVYAIQAGREIRVFVNSIEVDDLAAIQMAKDIAKKIEAELKYPGEVRVTLIREKRVIEYAR